MPFKIGLCGLIWLAGAVLCYSQTSSTLVRTPFFQSFGLPEGLPSLEVYDLAASSTGKLLVSTETGLFSFDGQFFYPIPNRLPLPLSPVFTHMVNDKSGNFWGNNFSNQLLRIWNDSLEVVRGTPLLPNEYWITPLLAHNEIFFVSSCRIFTLTENSTYTELFRIPDWQASTPINEIITSAIHLNHPSDWLIAGTHFLKHISSNRVVKNWNIPFRQPRLILYSDEIYLFECSDGADHYLKWKNGKISEIPLSGLKDNQVYHPTVAGSFLWLCTARGVIQIDKTGKSQTFFNDYAISSVTQDREGNFWLGTLENGLLKVPFFDAQIINTSWLPNEKITSVCKGPKNSIFAGTNRGRIVYIHPERKTVSLIQTQREAATHGLHYDQENNLIYSNLGVFSWPDKTLLEGIDGGTRFIPLGSGFYARSLHVGVLFENPSSQSKNFGSFGSRLFHRRTYDVTFREADSTFLAATATGLVYIGIDQVEHPITTESGEPIIARHILPISTHWHLVGTDLQGIFLLHRYTPVWQWTMLNNQPMSRIKNLFREQGFIYVVFEEGFAKVRHPNQPDAHLRYYPAIGGKVGIKDLIVFPSYAFVLMADGLLEVPNQFFNRSRPNPLLSITKVRDGEINLLMSGQPFRLSNKKIEVNFELISFSTQNHLQLYYSLSPSQTYTIPAGSRSIQLPGLSGGTYHLNIYCVDKKSGNRIAEAAMTFVIPKPYYQRPGILLFCFALLALVMYFLLQWQRKSFQKKQMLNEQVLTSRLQTLRAQMNPHFLFNVLNAVQGYIYSNQKERASEYLGKFSSLMRQVLHLSDKEWVSLEEDLDALEFYLSLEKGRLNDSLEYRIIRSFSPGKWQIPPMLIQPLAENAIKHGLLHLRAAKVLEIEIKEDLTNTALFVRVEDNGIGRKRSQEINQSRKLPHQPFATRAMDTRISLLNRLGKVTISLHYTDKENKLGHANGTKVNLHIQYTD